VVVVSHYKIYTDGGSRGNPGPAGIGLVIYDGLTGEVVYELGDYLGTATNNVAEYTALVRALEIAKDLGAAKVEVFADSELMIKQLNGQYKVKNEGLIPLYQKVRFQAGKIASCTYTHVPRAKNKRADQLANLAMDKKAMVGGDARDTGVSPENTNAKPGAAIAKPPQGTAIIQEIAFAYSSPFAPTGKVVPLAPGIYRETVAAGEKMLQLKAYLVKGAKLPPHTHFHEQTSFILQGKVSFSSREGEKVFNQGQAINFPGDLEHGAEVLENTIILDTFVPVREEYLD
jgi:ribonuclease HI